MTDRNFEGVSIEMLPLPTLFSTLSHAVQQRAINYARAVAEHNVKERDAEIEALVNQRDFLVEEYERAVGCGPQGYTHAAMHLFNAITNAKADENTKVIEALRAEVERWKVPLLEWLDKTDWAQQTVKPVELGHHRADIMRLRLEQAEARAERLAEALRESHAEVLRLRDAMFRVYATAANGGDPMGAIEKMRDEMEKPWSGDKARAALRDHDQEGGER